MLNIEEVKEELVGKSINFKGENFIITDIDESILKTHVNNEIKADIKVILSDGRGIALFSALGASKATVDADTYEYLKIIAPEIWELTEQAKLEEQARILAEQQEREEKEKAEAIKKAEAKYEKHVQATLNRYNAWKAL